MAIPKGITREHVEQAIRELDRDVAHPFGPSTKFDLVFDGRRYPPKAVVGIATRFATGKQLGPDDLFGGEAPGSANPLLRSLGFTIEQKRSGQGREDNGLAAPTGRAWLARISWYAGAPGWEPWQCIYAPSQDSSRAKPHEIMREPQPGDLVIHLEGSGQGRGRNDDRFTARSYVARGMVEHRDIPPQPRPWGRAPYYRIDLEDYKRFRQSVYLERVSATHGDEIRRVLSQEAPARRAFVADGGRLKPAPSSLLSPLSPGMLDILRRALPRDVTGGFSSGPGDPVSTQENPTPGSAPSERQFGAIPGVPVGAQFANRRVLATAGVHRPLIAGISGSGDEGTESIVMSGGYQDDVDDGDEVVYTGEGGNDPNTGRQTGHQTLTRGNRALAKSSMTGLPIRVIRGAGLESEYAPESGFRYDGLYRVEDFWHQRGQTGFRIYRCRLRRIDPIPAPWGTSESVLVVQPPYTPPELPGRRATTVQRVIRDTAMARHVKDLHGHRCQVCGVRLETPLGVYAEGAHIHPLGSPHNGPDTPDNVLCLCPNHHLLFDKWAFTIAEDLTLVGLEGRLRIVPRHRIRAEHLAYHRSRYGTERDDS